MKLLITNIILAFLGFLDATYLTILHYKNIIPPCSIAHGCEKVLTSPYAMIGLVPLALIGVGYFVTLLSTLILFLQTRNKFILNFILLVTTFSFIISLGLVALQAFVIHAFCQYCLGVEGINTLIFAIVVIIKRSH